MDLWYPRRMRVLVCGRSKLAHRVYKGLMATEGANNVHHLINPSSMEVNIQTAWDFQPEIIANLDHVDSDPDDARLMFIAVGDSPRAKLIRSNTVTASNLAVTARMVGALLVYVSTQEVFNGRPGFANVHMKPWPRDDEALTRYWAEVVSRELCEDSAIVRVPKVVDLDTPAISKFMWAAENAKWRESVSVYAEATKETLAPITSVAMGIVLRILTVEPGETAHLAPDRPASLYHLLKSHTRLHVKVDEMPPKRPGKGWPDVGVELVPSEGMNMGDPFAMFDRFMEKRAPDLNALPH